MIIACQDHCLTQFFSLQFCASLVRGMKLLSVNSILHSLNSIKIGFVFKRNNHMQFGADWLGNCWNIWCLKPWTKHLSAQSDYPNYFHLSTIWHHNGNSEQKRQPRVITRRALKSSAPRAGGNWNQLQLRLCRRVIFCPAVVESPGVFYPLKRLT